MPITRVPILDDDGSGTTGTVIDNAWKQQFYDQIDAGWWDPLTFANVPPSAFTANNGATWSVGAGMQIYYQYHRAKIMLLTGFISTSTITGAPTNLFMKIPADRVAAQHTVGASYLAHGAVGFEPSILIAHTNASTVAFYRPAIGQYSAGACNVYFSILIPLV